MTGHHDVMGALATSDARAVAGWLAAREDEMVETLTRLASVESPSGWRPGLEEAAVVVSDELAASGLRPRTGGGDATVWVLGRPDGGARPRSYQLVLGHLDTVWPVGTLERMPVRREGGRLHGPGVFDMKGGIVQLVYALRALDAVGLAPSAAPVVLLTGDEEVGSRQSRGLITRLAGLACRAFVLEPSFGSRGALKVARKGVGRFEVRIKGRAAHAGIDPGQGVSAILEASHQIQSIDALNDPERGVTVNVGTVEGGMRPNVVAPEASVVVEARTRRLDDARAVERALRALTPALDGTTIEVSGGFGRPPMEQTPGGSRLLALAKEAGHLLGSPIEGASVGGASDGNLIAGLVPVLDGLGAVGDGAHADHEHVVVSTLPERAALLAMLLAAPLDTPRPADEPPEPPR